MLHAGDEYLISTLIPFEPAQISFDPREFFHLLLIFLNQPSFDNLVGLSASRIGVTVNLVLGSVLTWQENFMSSYQSECFFDGLLTLMSSLLNYHRRNVDLESARCPPPKGRFLTTSAASKGEKKPAHSDNNNAPAVKLPTEIVEITSDPRTSEEDKVEMPADAY
ncbi:unnamed protein product [Brassica rapa]|uniref:Uncharacterized protein n=1 Tax=Brassica campestris TaxID=3711 RepID=A0A8D9GQ36_BRACM|nr:unnamed protein product [Brassica rapa]